MEEFNCTVCDLKFASKRDLDQHIRKQHSEQVGNADATIPMDSAVQGKNKSSQGGKGSPERQSGDVS